MDYLNGQYIISSFSVSLWQGDTQLGWFRPKNIYPEGMLLNGALDHLHDNSIVTVWIELKKHGEYKFHRLKALVHQQSDATELIWLNQNADFAGLFPYIAIPPVGESRAMTSYTRMSDAMASH